MACSLKHSLSGPISVQQFFQSFSEAWRNIIPRHQQRATLLHVPRRIGIAVSGGADSMALAYLCRQLQVAKPELELIVKAFIIDHKAREESSEEAHRVAKWLANLGIDSEILALDWSLDKKATEVTAFETHARTKRYRALGKACYENRLGALLTGHHLDDNVETAILRLTQHSKREGLAGIAPVARIPECHGLWGLSESGSFHKIQGQQRRLYDKLEPQKLNTDTTRDCDLPQTTTTTKTSFTMATGGILLCRPLLPFPKSSILETCLQSNVSYVTDPTNFDATLTARNAIRSLISANKLPHALRVPSMSAFLAKNRDSLQDLVLQTDDLLAECKLLEFHAESTTMKIQFPAPSSDASSDPVLSATTKTKNARVQAATLRRITELVSPLEDRKSPALNEYDRFAYMIFTGQQTEDFTLAGAHYRLLQPDDNIWHISRAPFKARSEPIRTIGNLCKDWCAPILWDNRYWFQFRLHPSSPQQPDSSSPPSPLPTDSSYSAPVIKVRSLRNEDMAQINMLLKERGQSRGLFRYMAPFKSRFTLPILTTTNPTMHGGDDNNAIEGKGENYLALPTLDMKLGELLGSAKVEWRWGYKKIDSEALRLMGWLV